MMLTLRHVAARPRAYIQCRITFSLHFSSQSTKEHSWRDAPDDESSQAGLGIHNTQRPFSSSETQLRAPVMTQNHTSDKQPFHRQPGKANLYEGERLTESTRRSERLAADSAVDLKLAARQVHAHGGPRAECGIKDFDIRETPATESPKRSPGPSNNLPSGFSPLLLRDMCSCFKCVDVSTKQKLFSTFDIPESIYVKTVDSGGDNLELTWENDVPGYSGHTTVISKATLSRLSAAKSPVPAPELPTRSFWDDTQFRAECEDLDFKSYMQDDRTLYQALNQLHKYGLLFVTNVPSSAESVSQIAERIGPLKNTFYGSTWDVRSVPQPKNVAYTSQDLGFHMDLLYMRQPPHIQFLHCIRSSARGGASLFTDSFKAAADLYWDKDVDAFEILSGLKVTHHYNHLDSHFYEQSRPTIELADLRFGGMSFADLADMNMQARIDRTNSWALQHFSPEQFITSVSWAPPFQAPFRLDSQIQSAGDDPVSILGKRIQRWHNAARIFNQLIHRREGIYERMMKPGECVIFDNRRVLHARKAFEVGDLGTERWLRGTYVDWDPFVSKLKVLKNRYGDAALNADPNAADA